MTEMNPPDGLLIRGWAELDGQKLDVPDARALIAEGLASLSRCGGEFCIEWDGCAARDHYGIMPGDIPAGNVSCNGKVVAIIEPDPPEMPLAEAISEAVRLRSDRGAVAFSGGVDSALVAALAGLPCITVGLPDSHDLSHARHVAAALNLEYIPVEIRESEVEEALLEVLGVIPRPTPVDASIATTLWFVARKAAECGYERILAGQGADELFGGYARYLESEDLRGDMESDRQGLSVQCARDQAVASLFGTYFSLPYCDIRVMRAAGAIPKDLLIREGVRKCPLREVALGHMPADIAYYEKKAMQYGSGIWKVIQRLARQNGYKNTVQRYINQLSRADP